ncbi:MAG: ABC transporter permease [Puniceicoccales bacterium]|nr:ABC transporter permease [Puniceicoccales bacterium]
MENIVQNSRLSVTFDLGTLHVECKGEWPTSGSIPEFDPFAFNGKIKRITLDATHLLKITSPFLIFLHNLRHWAEKNRFPLVLQNVPEGVERIFRLSQTPEPRPPRVTSQRNWIYRIGERAMESHAHLLDGLAFLRSTAMALGRLMKQWPRDFRTNLLPFLYQTGMEAFPIVALISILVGLIMAFVSVIQLERLGASIYVADLVGLVMTREMGCLMTAVIMAGRTGAAFAASIGSMQANEELDALRTFAIDQIDYLVLPRVVALALMMPLLCVFSDLLGIAGGMFSALPLMDCSMTQYIHETKQAVEISDVVIGLVKSFCFGIIVATIGCFKGICCGRNAAAVGDATTSAVVQGITWIIIADAIFALICTALGI